jgi:outer membrane protein assembly factor BamB
VAAGFTCESLPFAATTPVPEASGAAWITLDGKPELLVISDSGNHGAYGIVDPDTGATIETGTLPLSDEASDDIEGVSARGDRIYGITSSGWIRVWRRRAGAATAAQDRFELIDRPYPLGPIDLPDAKNNARAPSGDGMVCNGRVVNCGRNYEGLCLAPAPRSDSCIGFAGSKADGHLYCLTESAGKLVVHRDRAIAITRPGALADCAFGDDGTLWVGSNMFDLGRVYRVSHWDDPAAAQVERVGSLAVGFPETIAARGDVIYRMSDLGGAPSMMARFRCRHD